MAEEPLDSHPARYWHKLEDGRIQCDLCPRFCRLHQDQRAFCFVRARQDDQIVLTTYGPGGMSKAAQWWNVSAGASGSSQISRKLRVPSRAPDHAKGGDTLSPSQVYFFGMSPPCRKAALVSLNGMSASVIFGLRSELPT